MSSSSYINSSEVHRDSTASSSSTKSVKNVMKVAARRYKEHNASVQNAFETYYGINAVGYPVRKASVDSVSSNESASSPSGVKKAWKAVKKHAAEHNASVNSAYSLLYGAPAAR